MRQPATDLLLPALGVSAVVHLGVLFGVPLTLPVQPAAPQALQARLQMSAAPVAAQATLHARTPAPRPARAAEVAGSASPVAIESVTTPVASDPTQEAPTTARSLVAYDRMSVLDSAAQGTAAALESTYYPAEQLDVPPHLLGDVQQVYPARARAAEIEGTVTLSLFINERGGVDEVGVVQAQPQGYFEAAALVMLRGQNFTPAIKQGHAVKSRWLTTVRYRLQG